MLRIGLLGGGNIGAVRADALATIPGARLVGVAEQDAARRAAMSDRHGVPGHASLAELLACGCDVVDVCLPTPAHHGAVGAILAAGVKHVFCEKPLARTVEDARDLVERAEALGAILYVGHVLRFTPVWEEARAAILRGDVGQPAVARTSRGGPPSAAAWFHDRAQSGGVLLDMLVHDFDWLRWCFGEVARVYARVAPEGSPVDHALVTLRFASGVIAHAEGSWGRGRFGTTLEVAGDAGLLTHASRETDPLAIDLLPGQTASAPAWGYSPALAGVDAPHRRELAHFVECVQSGAEPRITAHDALRAVEIAIAAQRSARLGAPVAPGAAP